MESEQDLYRKFAAEHFGIEYDAVTPEQRMWMKEHLFTRIYGSVHDAFKRKADEDIIRGFGVDFGNTEESPGGIPYVNWHHTKGSSYTTYTESSEFSKNDFEEIKRWAEAAKKKKNPWGYDTSPFSSNPNVSKKDWEDMHRNHWAGSPAYEETEEELGREKQDSDDEEAIESGKMLDLTFNEDKPILLGPGGNDENNPSTDL